MSSKLYVGGLPYSSTSSDLTELFSAHGTVESVNVITDKFTGQSRGFGFVEMATKGRGSGGHYRAAFERTWWPNANGQRSKTPSSPDRG